MPPKSSRRLPWTDEMDISLLNLVMTSGVHIAGHNDKKRHWTLINEQFFGRPEMQEYRTDFYNKDDYRKLRDRFTTLLSDIQRDIDIGNQSGKSGELNELYELVQKIKIEIDTNEEEKENEKERKLSDKKKINETSDEVLALAQSGSVKRRLSESSLQSRESKKPSATFDEKIIQFMSSNENKRDEQFSEEAIEETIKGYLARKEITMSSICDSINASEEMKELFESIGLETLISIYCSLGNNFKPQLFKDQIKEIGCDLIITHKIYNALQNIRKAATNEISSPSLTTPSQSPSDHVAFV